MSLSVQPSGPFVLNRIRRGRLPVFAYYVILSLVMTYPLILKFTTMFPGDGGDGYLYVWHFWYFRKQILHLSNPFFTTEMFYPVGTSLVFTAYTLVSDVAATILYFFIPNLVVVSNGLFLLAYVLSGYCMFLLADYLTNNKWAALFAGTIFAFCPPHMARLLGHFDLMLTHWIPLFILFFLKATGPKGTYRQAVAAGLMAVLTLLDASYYYTVFLIFFVGFFYLYNSCLSEQRKIYLTRSALKRAAVLAGTALLAAAPYLGLAYRHARAGYYEKVEGWMGANTFVADVTGFFTPSFLHPIWKDSLTNYYFNRLNNTIEGIVFMGWLVAILAAVAIFFLARRQPELRLWRVLLIAFSILALGPTLHYRGRFLADLGEFPVTVPLPFLLVHYIPLIGHLRCPSRFIIMSMLCASILSAYTGLWIKERLARRRLAGALVFSLLTLITLIEYVNVPFPLCRAKVPAVFDNIAADHSPGTLLEAPFAITDGTYGRGNNESGSFWAYVQSVHGKKRIGGYTSRGSKIVVDYYRRFPIIQSLLDLEERTMQAFGQPSVGQSLTPEQEKAETETAIQALEALNQQAEAQAEADKSTVEELIQHTTLRYIVIDARFKDLPPHRYLIKVFNLGNPDFQDAEGYVAYHVTERVQGSGQGAVKLRSARSPVGNGG